MGSDCFLSLDEKFKQRYKVKINNMQVFLSAKKVQTFR